jgi:hypothetical protein
MFKIFFYLAFLVSLFSFSLLADVEQCWVRAYGRVKGTTPSVCPPNYGYDNGRCTGHCRPGYEKDKLFNLCWTECPNLPGWENQGYFCKKPAPEGRGFGYIITLEEKCNNEHTDVGGCEKYWWMWYPKCKPGWVNHGCCICSPNCPGMLDDGISCIKDVQVLDEKQATCHPSLETINGLCYEHCERNLKSVGTLCIGRCPSGYTPCGPLCMKGFVTCANEMLAAINAKSIGAIESFTNRSNYTEKTSIDFSKFINYPLSTLC